MARKNLVVLPAQKAGDRG